MSNPSIRVYVCRKHGDTIYYIHDLKLKIDISFDLHSSNSIDANIDKILPIVIDKVIEHVNPASPIDTFTDSFDHVISLFNNCDFRVELFNINIYSNEWNDIVNSSITLVGQTNCIHTDKYNLYCSIMNTEHAINYIKNKQFNTTKKVEPSKPEEKYMKDNNENYIRVQAYKNESESCVVYHIPSLKLKVTTYNLSLVPVITNHLSNYITGVSNLAGIIIDANLLAQYIQSINTSFSYNSLKIEYFDPSVYGVFSINMNYRNATDMSIPISKLAYDRYMQVMSNISVAMPQSYTGGHILDRQKNTPMSMPFPFIGAQDPNKTVEYNTAMEINTLKLRVTNLAKELDVVRNTLNSEKIIAEFKDTYMPNNSSIHELTGRIDELEKNYQNIQLRKELTDMTDMIDRVSSNSRTFNVYEETAKYLDMSFNSQLKIINEASENIGRSRLPILIRMHETRTILLNAVRQSGKSTWLRSKISKMTNNEVIIISFNSSYKLNVPGKENNEMYIDDFWKINIENENVSKNMTESLRFVVIDNFRTCSKSHINQLMSAIGKINPNVIFILVY